MKRYFLSLLIVPLLLIGCYSKANVEGPVISQNGGYTINLDDSALGIKFVEINTDCSYLMYDYTCSQATCDVRYTLKKTIGLIQLFDPKSDKQQIRISCVPSGNYTTKYQLIYPDPPLVPGGTANFTPVITGLTSSINEFIPYVVYIGLGVLGVLIGFVAIKRLINWVRAKIFSSFK